MREQLRALIRKLASECDPDSERHWIDYASAWLDGRMMNGQHADPFENKPSTPRSWVLTAKVGTTIAAFKTKEEYAAARRLEWAACAVAYLEEGNATRAAWFVSKAK